MQTNLSNKDEGLSVQIYKFMKRFAGAGLTQIFYRMRSAGDGEQYRNFGHFPNGANETIKIHCFSIFMIKDY